MIQIELFSAIYSAIHSTGYDIYEGMLPPEGTKYPFVYLADASTQEGSIKSGRMGTYSQSIHVWSSRVDRRGDTARMMEVILQKCARITATEHFGVMLQSFTTHLLHDNTTKTPLLHGVIELKYHYS